MAFATANPTEEWWVKFKRPGKRGQESNGVGSVYGRDIFAAIGVCRDHDVFGELQIAKADQRPLKWVTVPSAIPVNSTAFVADKRFQCGQRRV